MKKTFKFLLLLATAALITACGAGNNAAETTAPETVPSAQPTDAATTAAAPADTTTADTTQAAAVPDGAEEAARAYYRTTVFEVVSLEVRSVDAERVIFTVTAKRGGDLLEQPRSIELTLVGGVWTVTNEGY